MYIYTYEYISIYSFQYIDLFMHLQICVYIHIYVYMCTQRCIYICQSMSMYVPTYACMQRTFGVVTIDLMTKEMMRKCFVQFCGLCNRDSEMKQW